MRLFRRRKKEVVAAESVLELGELRSLREMISNIIRTVGIVGPVEKEMTRLPRDERGSIAGRAAAVFAQLKRVEKIQKTEVKELISLAKSVMDRESREGFERELAIEEDLRQKTLTLEKLFRNILWHFGQTGDRRYFYNFLKIVWRKVDDEINEAEKKASEAA